MSASFASWPTFLTALVLGYVLALLLTVLLAIYVARSHGETAIGRVFTLMVASFAFWIVGSLARLFTTEPGPFVAISTVKYVGIATAPVWFLLFALLYAGNARWVTPRAVAALLVVPGLEVLTLATTMVHRSFYTEFTPTTLGPITILDAAVGPAFWVFATYGWGLLVVGSVVFVSAGIKRSGLYRAQSTLIILAVFVSAAANVAYVFWDWPHHALDPTPFGFAITSLLLAVGIFSTRLIDVVPAARSLVMDVIDTRVIVLDPKERIVDVNETARKLVDHDHPIGESATEALPPVLLEPTATESNTVELDDEGESRHYRYRTFPIGPDGTYGTVIVLSDVTRQFRMQRDLERQNEQLSEFASVVSHDLRNPLNVAKGNLRLAREDCDGDRLERVERAHERMETLIDDLLVLARQGQPVGTVEPVDVQAIARQAWGTVQSSDASLALSSDDIPVQADSSRLVQLFENLFRNAVEHGGPSVSVRVGPLDDGFYVEDDGPGLPPAGGADHFERGVTTKDSGTGFGLAIVKSIVDAHGWRVTATDGTDGGARFEITGVEPR